MIPYRNELGLRDYRANVAGGELAPPRWPWLVLIAFLVGLILGVVR